MWNYAQYTKIAKEYGGPEKYIEAIYKNGFKQGVYKASVQAIPIVLLLGIICWVGGSHYTNMKVNKTLAMDKEYEESKEQILNRLKETEFPNDEDIID